MSETRKTLEFDTERLMADIYDSKTESLRDASAKTGVSASTLSRINNGAMPDMETFFKLCESMNLDPSRYFVWYEWVGKRVTNEDDGRTRTNG